LLMAALLIEAAGDVEVLAPRAPCTAQLPPRRQQSLQASGIPDVPLRGLGRFGRCVLWA